MSGDNKHLAPLSPIELLQRSSDRVERYLRFKIDDKSDSAPVYPIWLLHKSSVNVLRLIKLMIEVKRYSDPMSFR